jgi:hypothetical protein
MYAWIWRHLPFGLPGRIGGSLALLAATGALLWYVVFPWVEPLMPFDDVQVTQDGATPGDAIDTSSDPSAEADPSLEDENAIPYATHSNDPVPSATSNR